MKIFSYKENNVFKNLLVLIFWLLVWQIASTLIGEEILLVSPLNVFKRLGELVFQGFFWSSIFSTLSKILLGFLFALVIGVAFSIFSFLSPVFRTLIYPLIVFFRSVPVASFVILLLVWVDSSNLSTYIAFIMGLPIIYLNTYTGFVSVDKKLIEMCDSFKVSMFKRFRYIYLLKTKPYLNSAILTSMGLMFKAGIAAEVIGVSRNSIGGNLYDAKIYLNMPDLFAWTLVIIIISMILEKIFKKIFGDKDAGI